MPAKPKRLGIKANRQNKTKSKEPTPVSPRISESWNRNPKLSNITTKYGANGTRAFHGHHLHDYADGLEGLFEFCYRGTYTCTTSTAPGLEKAMKQFLRDARVFVVGDKYMADGLVARALNGAKADVEYGLVARSPDNLETRRFLKWVVETVYLRQHILGSEQEASDTRVGDEEAGGETEYSEEDPDAYTADDFDMGHFLYIPT